MTETGDSLTKLKEFMENSHQAKILGKENKEQVIKVIEQYQELKRMVKTGQLVETGQIPVEDLVRGKASRTSTGSTEHDLIVSRDLEQIIQEIQDEIKDTAKNELISRDLTMLIVALSQRAIDLKERNEKLEKVVKGV